MSASESAEDSKFFLPLLDKLAQPKIELRLKISFLSELRDILDYICAVDYGAFLARFMPIVLDILTNIEIKYMDNVPEQRIRSLVLDITSKLLFNDVFKPFSTEMCDCLIGVIERDNEDNSLIALRLFVEIHKIYRNFLEENAGSFIDVTFKMLSALPLTLREHFEGGGSLSPAHPSASMFTPSGVAQHTSVSPAPLAAATATSSSHMGSLTSTASACEPSMTGRSLLRATLSFKVLCELPVFLIMFFQVHRKFANDGILRFIPLIFQTLSLQVRAQSDAMAQNPHLVGVAPEIRNKNLYVEFIMLQVKALSFLAYVARVFPALVRPHQNLIPSCVLQLYRNCPAESVFIRKELLVSTRHLFTNDFQKLFVPFVDGFMNESFSLGSGVACNQMIRTLLYSMLADLIHHVRMELSPIVLTRVISVFSKNIHDSSLPLNLQSMSAKLVLNIVIDCLVSDRFPIEQRPRIFSRILGTFITKISLLKGSIQQQPDKSAASSNATSAIAGDEACIANVDVVKETKFLLKTLISGMKSILFAFRSCFPSPVVHPNSIFCIRGFSIEDRYLFHEYFRSCIDCFEMFTVPQPEKTAQAADFSRTISKIFAGDTESVSAASKTFNLWTECDSELSELMNPLPLSAIPPEDKELIDQFAYSFTVLDLAIYQDIFIANIAYLIEKATTNLSLLAIPQYFLAISGVSKQFCSILIKFLMEDIDNLGNKPIVYIQIVLRLFKLIFLSITVYPEDNEAVVQPFMADIVLKCLRHGSSTKYPLCYFLLLRSLFRSIGGGKYELLYKEILPLLPFLLETLNSLLKSATNSVLNELLVELCLTTPVRLSALLPHLGYLMRPMLFALKSSNELISQGLRTLELCIDNLTQDFIDPVLTPYYSQLIYLLWTHLKPAPYNQSHAHSAVRILGKLSGRSRRICRKNADLSVKPEVTACLFANFPLSFDGNADGLDAIVQIDDFCSLAGLFLADHSNAIEQKADVLEFCIYAFAKLLRFNAETFEKEPDFDLCTAPNQLLIDLFSGILQCTRFNATAERSKSFLIRFATFYAKNRIFEFESARLQSVVQLSSADSLSFLYDGLCESIANLESDAVYVTAHEMLHCIYNIWLSHFEDSKEALGNSNLLAPFAAKFTSICYAKEVEKKTAGFRGISLMITSLDSGIKWLWSQELRFMRGLLYVLKDTHNTLLSHKLFEQTKSVLKHLIDVCNADLNEQSGAPSRARIGYFNQLVSLLISELPNSDKLVRETVQSCLHQLSEKVKVNLCDLLMPVKDRLLAPIFTKPLRALPFNIQIGHIDAVTFCLELRPSLLTFNDELLRLLHEALALADADDASLGGKSTQLKSSAQILTLRIVCVKLLSSALACNELQQPESEGLRGRILALFFKCLYAKSNEVVEVAMKGLELATANHQKLSKDLLQNGLRPILSNLSEARKLTVQGLDGLSRLLQLLTGYFKAEIGKKLLDHMSQLIDPAVLEEISNAGTICTANEIKIFVGIVEIFHLLPSTANQFMDDLVSVVVSLEGALRINESSPFRKPLLKYLAKYPADAVAYFVSKVASSPAILFLFCHLLKSPLSLTLRDEIHKTQSRLLSIVSLENFDSIVAFIKICHTLIADAHLVPDAEALLETWLTGNKKMIEALFSLFQTNQFIPRSEEEEFGHPLIIHYIPQFLAVATAFLRHNLDEISYIFELLQIFLLKNIPEMTVLTQFFAADIIKRLSLAQRKTAMTLFLGGISVAPDDLKTIVFKNFVTPLVAESFARDADATRREILDFASINELLWATYNPDTCPFDDRLKIELLNFTNVLIANSPNEVAPFRRMIVKVLWSNIGADDVILKQASFSALAKFALNYEMPPRILLQGFVCLVRSAFTPDGKSLPIKSSFDTFVPALLEKLNNVADRQSWMMYTRRILLEEPCHSLTPAIFLWQIMIKKPAYFKDWAESFIPFIVHSLSRIGFSANATADQKVLTMDLCDLLFEWYQSAQTAASDIPSINTEVFVDLTANYLFRFLVVFAIDGSVHETKNKVLSRAFLIFKNYMKQWNSIIRIKFAVLNERIQAIGADGATTNEEALFCFFGNVMHILMCFNQRDDIRHVDVTKIVARVLVANNQKLLTTAKQFILFLLAAQPDNGGQKEAASLPAWLTTDEDSVARFIESFIHQSIAASSNLNSLLMVLQLANVQIVADVLCSVSHALDKLFAALVQAYVSQPHGATAALVGTAVPGSAQASAPLTASATSIVSSSATTSSEVNYTDVFPMLILVLARRTTVDSDHKANFLSSMLALINAVRDEAPLKFLFEIIAFWVLADEPDAHQHAQQAPFFVRVAKEDFVGCSLSYCSFKDKLLLFSNIVLAIKGSHSAFIGTNTELFFGVLYAVFSSDHIDFMLKQNSEVAEEMEFFYIIGLTSSHSQIKRMFLTLLYAKIPAEYKKSLVKLLEYVFRVVSWEPFKDGFWLSVVVELLFHHATVHDSVTEKAANSATSFVEGVVRILCFGNGSFGFVWWTKFFPQLWKQLSTKNGSFASQRIETISKSLIFCLSREYNNFQAVKKSHNVIQALLTSFVDCEPSIPLPSHLICYLAKTFNVWHTGMCLLEKMYEYSSSATELSIKFLFADNDVAEAVMTANDNALSRLYDIVGESDYYFGLERRRSKFSETLCAISLQQMQCWPAAQLAYESAQNKARNGAVGFVEAEYNLWEREWVECTKRLQQWDLLGEIAKVENDPLNLIECFWRSLDSTGATSAAPASTGGATGSSVAAAAASSPTHAANAEQMAAALATIAGTPTTSIGNEPIWFGAYRKIFESFCFLNMAAAGQTEKVSDFQQSLEIAVQSALKAWESLPMGASRTQLCHLFQLMVELNESQAVYLNLNPVSITARPQIIAEIKGILSTWRDRLPNVYDDIAIWSELLAWRQHVFGAIGTHMQAIVGEQALLSSSQSANPNLQALGAFSFRGYHETAWLINKFAHVARKHSLQDVCLASLNKIYTLPNIEIQDAFKKLREQVKCYLVNATQNDLAAGLEIINATNLGYFVPAQKAEFFNFKAQFLARLDAMDDANRVFAQAVQIDLNSAKGWTAWGTFNDERFMSTKDIAWASNAVSCYLQAATLVKNGKGVRKLLSRVLWLLSFEDAQGTLGKIFDTYTAEFPVWHWIAFIPQLLASLARKESNQARFVLTKIAKTYPQALYFPLRTTNEDYKTNLHTSMATTAAMRNGSSSVAASPAAAVSSSGSNTQIQSDFAAYGASAVTPGSNSDEVQQGAPASATSQLGSAMQTAGSASPAPSRKTPPEYTDELMGILKTGYPLLALSMENMVEHIIQRLRASPDEDLYRILTTLLYEGFQQSFIKISAAAGTTGAASALNDPLSNTAIMESSLAKVSEILGSPSHLSSSNTKYKDSFDADFIDCRPNLHDVVTKLMAWREKIASVIGTIPRFIQLENFSRYLVEFDYQKYDEVDLPGQYLNLHKDNNADFVKIDRFEPTVEIVRRHGSSFRRISIRGHDGNVYVFCVQNPVARHARREEKIVQLLRFLNNVLDKKKETRRRNVHINIPVIVPLSAHVRIVSDAATNFSLEDVLDAHCKQLFGGAAASERVIVDARDELLAKLPLLSPTTTAASVATEGSNAAAAANRRGNPDLINVKTDIFEGMCQSTVPSSLLRTFVQQSLASWTDYWLLRKEFTLQYAAASFVCYVLSIAHRFPHKFLVDKRTGSVLMSDIMPSTNHLGLYTLNEAVPFRLTPNIQAFIGAVGIEGPFAAALMAMGQALCEPDFEAENFFALIIRDELAGVGGIAPASAVIASHAAAVAASTNGSSARNSFSLATATSGIGAAAEATVAAGNTTGAYDVDLLSKTIHNVDIILKRIQTIACVKDRDKFADCAGPVNQSVIDLVGSATNPQKLCQMEPHWHPWL